MNKRIGIIGLGTVGEAVFSLLNKHRSLVYKKTSLNLEVVKVSDARAEKRKVIGHSGTVFTVNPYDLINDPKIDIIVELIGGIDPARKYIFDALRQGKDVITANKALLAKYGKQIFSLAKKLNRSVGFEAAVCGAIPLIRIISEGLIPCKVKKIYGILNGTTNYILYKMLKDKISFASALKQAQNKGFAERRPNLDINGIDTLHKLSILSYLCFGFWPDLNKIYVEGISRISLLDVVYAQELDYTIKLLAIAKSHKDKLDLRVQPTLIPKDHSLSGVNSAFNAVWLDTYPAGDLLFYGAGAGGIPTSSSIISDIINIAFIPPRFIQGAKGVKLIERETLLNRYYIRFMAKDHPGVLAQISKILASFDISIASVTQKEREEKKFVPIVMITHQAKEGDIHKALAKIDKLSMISGPSQFIRIEDL